jgi:peptide deformylase
VDVHERLIVMDISEERNQPLVIVNPEIVWYSEARKIYEEGCLSVPGIFEKVRRAERITVSALDEVGASFELSASGLLSVCIQHEMDHLKGIVFVEYLSRLKRSRIASRLRKQQQQHKAL